MIPREHIQFTDQPLTWQQSISRAAQPLLTDGLIEERYIDAMIQTVIDSGPYIILAPKVAVPHARPEHGALSSGLALLRSTTPIAFDFGEDDDSEPGVELVFALCAADKTSHIGLLQKLAVLLGDDAHINALLDAPDADALYATITEITH